MQIWNPGLIPFETYGTFSQNAPHYINI